MTLAFASTTIVALIVNSLSSTDASFLERYSLSAENVQIIYFLLVGLTGLLMLFEPPLRRLLRAGRLHWFVMIAAGCLAFFVFQLTIPLQNKRLFDQPFSLWLIMAHISTLAILTIALVTPQPLAEPSAELYRRLRWVIGLSILILVIVQVASLGEFMQFDTPDEPWTGSLATTYFDTGRLTSTYLASAYGDPDIVFPRLYFLLMGTWARIIGNTSLETLRAFPLLVGMAAVLVLMWGMKGTNLTIRLVAATMMLAMVPFVRTSHNLRMDVPLGLYSACLIFGLFHYLNTDMRRWRWSIVLGASLFLGLQAIPTIAVLMGVSAGIILILDGLRNWQQTWIPMLVYGLICALMIALYFLFQLLPDIDRNLTLYRAFVSNYSRAADLFSQSPINTLIGLIRFSFLLSPIELPVVTVAFAMLAWRGGRQERALVLTVLISLLLMVVVVRVTYGYLVLFVPFAAYAIGQLMRWRIGLMIGVFALIPALASPAIHDLVHASQENNNRAMIRNDQALLAYIPPGATLVADDRLWFTLHGGRRFIGWNGVAATSGTTGLKYETTLKYLNMDYMICSSEFPTRCERLDSTGLFAAAFVVETPQLTYTIYERLR